jgi:hypothetical protein
LIIHKTDLIVCDPFLLNPDNAGGMKDTYFRKVVITQYPMPGKKLSFNSRSLR